MSGAPTAYSPTQSAGRPGPFAAVAVKPWPGLTVAALSVTLGAGGVSSLVIVPTPTPSPINAFAPFDRLTANVSFGSNVVSPFTVTLIVWVAVPGAKVSVPVAAT